MRKNELWNEFATKLRGGQFDDKLDEIRSLVQFRVDATKYDLMQELEIGDKVRFTRRARPQYLVGEQATVTGFRRSRITIRLDNSVGRFGSAASITCPLEIIEKVN